MAATAPAGAARDERRMVHIANQQHAGTGLLLEMALQAQVLIARDEHFLVHAAVRIVADGAAFADGFMFEDKRAALLRMALEAGFIRARRRSRATLDHPALVRIVAIAATHLAVLQ